MKTIDQNNPLEKTGKDPSTLLGADPPAPLLFFLGLVICYPLVYNFILSLTNQSLIGTRGEWGGLGNYLGVFLWVWKFWFSLKNGLVLSLSTTALPLIIGLCIALLLNQPMRGNPFFRDSPFPIRHSQYCGGPSFFTGFSMISTGCSIISS